MLLGSTSSKPAKTSCGLRPTTCTITFRRPRWLIASTACSAPLAAAISSASWRSGTSATAPSSEKRLLPV